MPSNESSTALGDPRASNRDDVRVGDVVRARLFPSLAPRPRIAHFTLLEQLGEGGMGSVWRARDERLERDVALKVVRDRVRSDRAQARLNREAKALARVSHPNIVPVFEVGEHHGEVFIAMELIDGSTMREWVVSRDWREVVTAYQDAAKGLAAAHEAGLVHRDFKPDNVLVDGRGHVRVADFGVASATDADDDLDEVPPTRRSRESGGTNEAGSMVGTPKYMAPEQLRGEGAGPASDQYAFCVSLWEGLHRTRPDHPPTIGGDSIPTRVDRVLARGLAHNPKERYPNMDALRDELARALEDRRRPRVPWIAGALGLALALALALARVTGSGGDPPNQDAPAKEVAASPCPTRSKPVWTWQAPADSPVSISPVHDGVLLAAVRDQRGPRLVTLSATDGSELASVRLAGVTPPLVSDASELYLERDASGHVFALQIEVGAPEFRDARVVRLAPDGSVAWETPIAPATATGPTLWLDGQGGVLVVVHDYQRRGDVLHHLDASGRVTWSYAGERGPDRRSPLEAVSVRGDVVYVAGVVRSDGKPVARLAELDLATGTPQDSGTRVLPFEAAPRPLGLHVLADDDALLTGFWDQGSSTFLARADARGRWRWAVDLDPEGRTSPRPAEYLRFRASESGACLSYLAAPAEAVTGENFTTVWCVDPQGQCVLWAQGDTPRVGGDLQRDDAGAAYVAWRETDGTSVRKFAPPSGAR